MNPGTYYNLHWNPKFHNPCSECFGDCSECGYALEVERNNAETDETKKN